MKVIVTGGTGYIGSHTVVELQNQDFEVIIIDNLANSSIEVLSAIQKITGITPHFEKLDLCDFNKTSDFFKKHNNISAVIHFAAYKAVGESVKNPLKYYNNNLFSLINLLQCMKENKINNLVFSSSCTVYGQPDKLPVTEEAPIKKALSPYGNTKQICEEIIQDTAISGHLKCISLRYFNPIGAHTSSQIGELPLGEPDNLIPYITQTAIGKRECLKVFGNDYNTPDGTAIRDYIHVVDLAKAHLMAVNKLLDKNNNKKLEIFNLGTGKGYSVLEIINTFEKISGQKLNYRFVDRREGDIEKVWADNQLANKELGWKAENELEQMLLSAWNWEKTISKK